MDSNANKLILPDSRLQQRPDLATQMVDWELPGGRTVRIEVAPIFCANCGLLFGHVPKDNTTFAFYLCSQCFEVYGVLEGTYVEPDDAFNRAVAHEMTERFGHGLTDVEIATALAQGRLGTALELLLRESPFPSVDQRPRG